MKHSIILNLLVLAVSVYMISTLSSLWMNLRELNAEHAELKRIKAAEETNIEELRTLLESGSKEQMIEKAARERLGYVYADEEIYVDISGN